MTAMATTNETADGLVKGKTAASEDDSQAPKANGNEASAMDCDGANEPTRNGDLNKSKNGDGEEEDDDDLSSDIGLIEDDEDIDAFVPHFHRIHISGEDNCGVSLCQL